MIDSIYVLIDTDITYPPMIGVNQFIYQSTQKGATPMIRGRPREFDRDQAIQAAMLLFWRKGFFATSMTDLCDAMGIRSPSLYAAFGSKESLYVEAVQHYSRTVLPSAFGCLEGSGPARRRVENFLFAAAKGLRKSAKTPGGCMVTLSILDEDAPAAVMSALKKARRESLESVRTRLQAAVAGGELPPSTEVNQLSRFYLGIVQGMAIQARDGATLSQLQGMARAAMLAWPRGPV
jgi:AcrR family transcriptional regulator